MTADLFLHLLSRFIHIGSVILLLGGVVYARQVLVPVLNTLPEDLRMQAAAGTQLRYRTTLYVLLVLIVISGLYNFFSYAGPKHGQTYQIWFGIKMLLVAHILSSAILWATAPYGDITVGGKSKHRLMSIAISGIIVVFISAYLRSLTQRGL
jgi:predicted exporter